MQTAVAFVVFAAILEVVFARLSGAVTESAGTFVFPPAHAVLKSVLLWRMFALCPSTSSPRRDPLLLCVRRGMPLEEVVVAL